MVENQLKTQLDLTQEDAEALVQTIIALPRTDIENFFALILSWPDITNPTVEERMQAGDDFFNGMTNNGPSHKKLMQNLTERSDLMYVQLAELDNKSRASK